MSYDIKPEHQLKYTQQQLEHIMQIERDKFKIKRIIWKTHTMNLTLVITRIIQDDEGITVEVR